MVNIVIKKIKDEIQSTTRKKNRRTIHSLAGAISLERLRDFNWKEVLTETESTMPTLYAVLNATTPPVPQLMKQKSNKNVKR